MSDLSTLLFARPSFLEGVARLIDFGDTLTEYNRSITGELADRIATSSDWAAIGRDVTRVMEQHGAASQPQE